MFAIYALYLLVGAKMTDLPELISVELKKKSGPPHDPYVAFFSHSQQIKWFSILADILRSKFNYKTVLFVLGEDDLLLAKSFPEFSHSINLLNSIVNVDYPEDDNDQLVYLKTLEESFGNYCLNMDIQMDRHFESAEWSQSQILQYLSRICVNLQHHITISGHPSFSVSETNVSHYRIIQRILKRPFFIPHAVAHQDRFYFETTMNAQWQTFQATFNLFYKEGVSSELMLRAKDEVNRFRASREKTKDFALEFKKSNQSNFFLKLKIGNLLRHVKENFIAVFYSTEQLLDPRYQHFLKKNIVTSLYKNLRLLIRKRFLSKNSLEFIPDGRKYCAYFMHMQPELTVEGLAFDYRNQIELCISIAARLPVDTILLVKEHYWMEGMRSIKLYRQLVNCPNIKIISNSVAPQDVIKNADIVFTLTGTCAIEATFFGIPSVVFGDIYFENLPGVTRVRSYTHLTDTINKLIKHNSGQKTYDHVAFTTWAALIEASFEGKLGSQYTFDDMNSQSNRECIEIAIKAFEKTLNNSL